MKKKLTRTIQIVSKDNKVEVTFWRHYDHFKDQNHYTFTINRLSPISLRRLDALTYAATKTTVMVFKTFIIVTAVFLTKKV